jgi:hypothetical protein
MSEGSAGIARQANVSTQHGTAAAPTPAFASQFCSEPAFGTQGATSTGHADLAASAACALGFQGLPAAGSFGSPALQAALVAAGHASGSESLGGAATAAPVFPAQASSVGAAAPFPPFSSFGATDSPNPFFPSFEASNAPNPFAQSLKAAAPFPPFSSFGTVTAPFPSFSSFGATDSPNPFFPSFEASNAPNPFAQSLKAAAPFPPFSSFGAVTAPFPSFSSFGATDSPHPFVASVAYQSATCMARSALNDADDSHWLRHSSLNNAARNV